MKVGDRILNTSTGEIGHIEEIDDMFLGMRVLTPDNVPSCCVSWGMIKHFIEIPDKVLPMPRSKAWKKTAKEFHEFIKDIVEDIGTHGSPNQSAE